MKSKEMQNLVLSKYNNSDRPTKIFRDLNGVISLATIERWCKMIQTDGSINLRKSPRSRKNHSNKGGHSKGQNES